jgi:predicted nucleotidyltransferase
MNLEYYTQEKLKKEVLAIVSKYLDTNKYRVFFFGSRVRGDNFAAADIDIGIDGPEEVSGAIKLQIKEDLENIPVLYKFDLVDFKSVSQDFRKEALKSVEYAG